MKDLIFGKTPPTGKFWGVQFGFLALLVLGPFVLFAIFSAGMKSAELPPAARLLVSASFLLPILAWLIHAIAVLRASSRAQSAGKILCRIYGGLLMVLPFLLIFLGVTNFSRFKFKSRQAEAKIALATIYGSEAWSEPGQSRNLNDPIGYSPEGKYSFYAYAIVRCHKAMGPVVKLIPSNLDSANVAVIEAALQEWASKESCEGRPSGFSAFAAGKILPDAGIDVWRIDEKKVLVNLQEGI